ncbi:glutamate-5-semialdehyde dehydrogenase [Ophiocordyceps camponoti-floridani]|uniref:glutamate-5-semialdehyde dehydrogenase n=1 Tax=Ophiocordyceps camponoti-floridani TaxID=2030778 RepID=A0A8H4VA78_9HYPO|nr:glutamate-5-semialdehyde dehydrogenase [Ophiocordyceps camponoti-floridani]
MSLTNGSAEDIAAAARRASSTLAALSVADRDAALEAVYSALEAAREDILAANARDVQAARAAAGADPALVDRLDLSRGREVWCRGYGFGRVQARTQLDDDLVLERVSCPIGVILVIFEARPEVIANIASLALKSGNAAILKGGKESTESFIAISHAISSALKASSVVPPAAIQLVTTREHVGSLLAQHRDIDLVIPRGSNQLVRDIKLGTRIPVLGHADGLCAVYLTDSADAEKAAALMVDAKTSYPAACNSVETLLVQESAVQTIFPVVAKALVEHGVTLLCDPPTRTSALSTVEDATLIQEATPKDYTTEFLSKTLAVKTMSSLDEAIAHINAHGSHHTDAILTASAPDAERFMQRVDSAGVFWNASTRVADGTRYGFGTEVGISTNKIHARGPVGLEGLTIYKYKLRGDYQPTAEYGTGKRRWKHEALPL